MTTVKNESGVITSVVLPVIVDGYKWECNKDRIDPTHVIWTQA